MSLTKEDIIRIIEEEDVKFIRMQFVDVLGQLKNVAITASQIERALNGQISIDGYAIKGFSNIHDSDQYLIPDLNTFCIYPWRPQRGKVARFICDVVNPDSTPYAGDSRAVLKRVVARAKQMGYTFQVGPECEFFLFQTDDEGKPTTKPNDEADYLDLSPLDHGESTRREICLALEELGFEIEASHHECAAGQHEIDFHYDEALRTADNIMTFKLGVKVLAQRNGLHATFMPKPIFGQCGSGMHINMSLFRNGKNVFYNPNGERQLSAEAYAFIAGLMAHVKGFTAVTNPLVNSYKRLVSGFEAPCHVAWSSANRSSLIRIPPARGEETRVELRSPDPTCNPYLALAVCLAAGLDGIEHFMTPPSEVTGNLYAMTADDRRTYGIETLPGDLKEALELMQRDKLVMDTLGEHVAGAFLHAKYAEWEEYSAHVSSWEREKYIIAY